MPHAFVLAIEEGLRGALSRGPLSNNRVAYCKVTVHEKDCDWDTDSSAASFRLCAALGLKQALQKANPIILEPMMKLEVHTPERSVGDVLSDLNSQRRAHIHEVGPSGTGRVGRSVIHAHVPLVHMVGYATTLRSRTQGEGSFSIQFHKYVEVDPATREKLVPKVATHIPFVS
jgi:elongation factor G